MFRTSCLVFGIFVELIRKCLEACDEDPDLVQLCYCLPPTENDDSANYFTSHPGFKHITFIGSQPVAHYILKCAAKSLTPVVVELGGKDAFIVLDSAKNLDALSSIIMRVLSNHPVKIVLVLRGLLSVRKIMMI